MTPRMNLILGGLAAVLSAAPISVGAPGLTVVQVDPRMAEIFTTSLAQQLTFRGVRVVTGPDMVQLLGYERQQQLLGCGDDGCRAKLMVSLGVDALLSGQVARLDKTYRLDVRLLEPGTGRVLGAASASADDADRLVANFSVVAEQLGQQLSTALGRPLVPSSDAQVITRWSTTKKAGFIPLALGAAAVATGIVGVVLSRNQYALLEGATPASPLTPEQVDRAVTAGKQQQTWGLAANLIGLGLLLAAGGLFLFGGEETVSAGVAVGPSGASIGLSGAF